MATSLKNVGVVNGQGVAKATRSSSVTDTGTFGAHRPARLSGYAEEVAAGERLRYGAAKRAERSWLRTLSKAQRRSLRSA